MSAEVETCLTAPPPHFRDAAKARRAQLKSPLPGHIECMSYAMPGFRDPKPKRKMAAGYAAFTHHLGLYPPSDSIIPNIDCAPLKTSKSGVLFTPDHLLPLALITQIIRARQAEIVT